MSVLNSNTNHVVTYGYNEAYNIGFWSYPCNFRFNPGFEQEDLTSVSLALIHYHKTGHLFILVDAVRNPHAANARITVQWENFDIGQRSPQRAGHGQLEGRLGLREITS